MKIYLRMISIGLVAVAGLLVVNKLELLELRLLLLVLVLYNKGLVIVGLCLDVLADDDPIILQGICISLQECFGLPLHHLIAV